MPTSCVIHGDLAVWLLDFKEDNRKLLSTLIGVFQNSYDMWLHTTSFTVKKNMLKEPAQTGEVFWFNDVCQVPEANKKSRKIVRLPIIVFILPKKYLFIQIF